MKPSVATNSIYVIMPVSSDPEYKAKRSIIEKVAAKLHYEPRFPMDRLSATEDESDRFSDTLAEIRTATVVLADLSYERPSCYYELGLSEAVGTPVRLVAAEGTDIHQSSARNRTWTFTDLPSYEIAVSEALAQGLTT